MKENFDSALITYLSNVTRTIFNKVFNRRQDKKSYRNLGISAWEIIEILFQNYRMLTLLQALQSYLKMSIDY